MDCNGEWTIRFPNIDGWDGPFEIRPHTMNFRQVRGKYDWCRAEFDHTVAEELAQHTRIEGGQLREATVAEVCLDGESQQVMYFQPDNVQYGDNGTYVELTDLQESLDTGVVDMEAQHGIPLVEAYEYAFEKRENDLLTDIKFTFADQIQDLPPRVGAALYPDQIEQVRADEQGITEQMLTSYYGLTFDQVSPAKAIWTLNEMFNLISWVDTEYNLWVGVPETNAVRHIAAPDDDRAWRYYDPSIRHPSAPIRGVVVKGKWVDEPGVNVSEKVTQFFLPAKTVSDSLTQSNPHGDVRAEGVAFRPGISRADGEFFEIDDTPAKRDALPHVAKQAFLERAKDQHKGSVNIDPELSGDLTPLAELTVGDFIHLVPDDDHFDFPTASSGEYPHRPSGFNDLCGDFVYNEVYLIVGVTHELTQGDWQISLELVIYPDFEIASYLRYFDPRSEEYITEEDLSEFYDSWEFSDDTDSTQLR